MDRPTAELLHKLNALALEARALETIAGMQIAGILYAICGDMIGGSLSGLAEVVRKYSEAQTEDLPFLLPFPPFED